MQAMARPTSLGAAAESATAPESIAGRPPAKAAPSPPSGLTVIALASKMPVFATLTVYRHSHACYRSAAERRVETSLAPSQDQGRRGELSLGFLDDNDPVGPQVSEHLAHAAGPEDRDRVHDLGLT